MPRMIAPPPSGEFSVLLAKPFSGTPAHSVEVFGQPNRTASVRTKQNSGGNTSLEKVGEMSKDDVNELLTLISTCRGFPSDPSKDIFGLDTKLEFNTFDLQWSNDDEDPNVNAVAEVGDETKDDFKRIVDSIEALGRTFAKQDSAI